MTSRQLDLLEPHSRPPPAERLRYSVTFRTLRPR